MSVPKRLFDIAFSLFAILTLSPLLFLVALLVNSTSRGGTLHWSKRVGQHNKQFFMPKFRTMKVDTPQLPTHLLTNPEEFLTPVGSFLRRTSLDELPQLFSILVGHLSFVGPRPALFNQDDLVAQRTERGIHGLVPGLTGWAQINGRDELPIPIKVQFDYEYLTRQSLRFDMQIIGLTIVKVARRDGIQH